VSFDWLLDRMRAWGDEPAVIWQDQVLSNGQILAGVSGWKNRLDALGIRRGQVVALEGDYSPRAISLLLALVDHDAIVVPLTTSAQAHRAEFIDTAEVEVSISFDASDQFQVIRRDTSVRNPLTRRLIESGHPGLVLFSSGSTGKSKAALHDFTALLEKFKASRHRMRILAFLLLDHIGGINTLLYTLSNGGTIVSVQSRDPELICQAIERYKVECLPTSPTFLNLLLLSEAYRRYDLASLELITYGTEVMPRSTLSRLHDVFPSVRLLQTYGLSELGILRSKSKDSNSLWVKVGGEGFETKIVDNVLWVRAQSAMLGYLNAPSPFDSEGWFNTEDVVEVDGDYIRILGRRSEMINVGGQKVYPAEVESVLQLMEGVEDVAVSGEPNPITGQMVTARVAMTTGESLKDFRNRMRAFCKGKLASYKIPQKVLLVDKLSYGERFKKMRSEF